MSKYLLEDMVKIKHPHKDVSKEIKQNFKAKIEEREKIIKIERKSKVEGSHHNDRSRYMLWTLAGVSIVFCLFALSFLFGNAKISVNPRTEDVVLNENLSASLNSNNNGLSFDLVVMEGVESKTLQATEEKSVAEKATGTVIIYNTFSSSSQTLSIDTRLEGSNGKIYKTQTKTNVPGMAKGGTPGQVEVGIYAVEAGAEYNSVPLDFKILGFKGTPKYSKFYGRSKTGTEITGGFKGKTPAISDVDKTNTILELKTTLQEKLLKKVNTPGFILFKDAIFFNVDSVDIPFTAQDNNLTITMKGTLRGIIFNEQKLTKKIAKNKIEKYDDSEVYIPNISDLTFSLSTPQADLSNKENVLFEDIKNISFNLSGPATIVFKLDVDKFSSLMLGKSKKDFNQILSQYENIISATLTLSPFWKKSIPDDMKDIKVIVNYPK
jgi:hypothetical protein